MKTCVFGAGAIGGWLAAKLALSGADVTVVARGAVADAIEKSGLSLKEGKAELVPSAVKVARTLADVAECDVLYLAVKAWQLPENAAAIAQLAAKGATVVSLQNGLPWWYFQSASGSGKPLAAVDPAGSLAHIPFSSLVGGIVYAASAVVSPGVIAVPGKGRIVLGEPDGSASPRLAQLVDGLRAAGIAAEATTDIRIQLWGKVLRNAVFNPLSCLSGASLGEMASDAPTAAVATAAMLEVVSVARSCGITISESPADVLAQTIKYGGSHKSSMLQDLEAGRTTELEAVLGSVIELAGRAAIAVPHLHTLYACAKLQSARRAGQA